MGNKQLFPGYRFHPETGKGQVFQSAEEVPEGWVANISEVKRGKRAVAGGEHTPEPENEDDKQEQLPFEPNDYEKAAIAKLVDDNSQKDLVAKLEELNAEREAAGLEAIEFLPSWPKLKLATEIVGGAVPQE